MHGEKLSYDSLDNGRQRQVVWENTALDYEDHNARDPKSQKDHTWTNDTIHIHDGNRANFEKSS